MIDMRDIICPRCSSGNIIKNGNTVYGRPEFMCGDCRKHFPENPDIREIA
jgi:transposase-like protein